MRLHSNRRICRERRHHENLKDRAVRAFDRPGVYLQLHRKRSCDSRSRPRNQAGAGERGGGGRPVPDGKSERCFRIGDPRAPHGADLRKSQYDALQPRRMQLKPSGYDSIKKNRKDRNFGSQPRRRRHAQPRADRGGGLCPGKHCGLFLSSRSAGFRQRRRTGRGSRRGRGSKTAAEAVRFG